MKEAFCLNVLDLGVDNTGGENVSAGIQEAIDRVSENGGGTVFFPPGGYLTGSLKLKSNVSLYLDGGAVIAGSSDIRDYEEISGKKYLISGIDCENAGISGGGTIDGRGQHFWHENDFFTQEPFYGKYKVFRPRSPRPFAALHFRDSSNINITGVRIINSPCYTVWLLGCDGARISGIRIINPHHGPNTDGLDIDCSSNVTVSDCSIDAGDDCIAVKSDTGELGRMKACENICVSNCQLSSTANAVRIGYEGDGPIRNCVFSNLVIHDCNQGVEIDVISGVERGQTDIKGGARIENIVFSGLTMDVHRAFYLWAGQQTPGVIEGYIRNVKFDNIIAKVNRGSHIGGCEESPIANVEFSNINITAGGEKGAEFQSGVPYPLSVWGEWNTSGLPHVFYCRHTENCSFRNITVNWTKDTTNWLSAVRFEKAKGIRVAGLQDGHKAGHPDYSVIRMNDVEDALISGCSLTEGNSVFLLLEGENIASVALCFNDLRKAVKSVLCRDRISPGAVEEYCNIPAVNG